MSRTPIALLAALAALAPLAACTDNDPDTGASGPITVSSTDDACTLSTTEVPSGNLVFRVTNDGSKVTEFYLLGSDGLSVVGEVENIGPGATRDLVVGVREGNYHTSCKPGMVGDGIVADFTVTAGEDITVSADIEDLVATATEQYALYVKDQTEQLVTGTEAFAEAYIAGDDDEARALYAPTRMHWERIEPVAESFGTLDPILDAREADLAEGDEWTGWHRIEKDLWPPANGYTAMTDAERKTIADQLVADTKTLYEEVLDTTYEAHDLGNGAKELLDEVATGKVTGEEEAWSHTDLWDFQANVDGARVAFENLRPALDKKDPELAETIDARFTDLQELLDQYRDGDGWVTYDQLTDEQVKELSDAVNALSEPLSKVTAAIVGS